MKKMASVALQNEGGEGADRSLFLTIVAEPLCEEPAIEGANYAVSGGFDFPRFGGLIVVVKKSIDGGFTRFLGRASSTDSIGNCGGNAFGGEGVIFGDTNAQRVFVFLLGTSFADLSDLDLNVPLEVHKEEYELK